MLGVAVCIAGDGNDWGIPMTYLESENPWMMMMMMMILGKSLKQAAAHRKCLWFADNLVATCTGDPVVQPRNYCRWYQQFRHLEGIGSQQGDLIDR